MSVLSNELNEMAKKAQDRITARLPANRKRIFYIGKFLESVNGLESIHKQQLKSFIVDKLHDSWEDFCQEFNIPEPDNIGPRSQVNAKELVNKFNEKYGKLYAHMKRTIVAHSDEIDKKYITPAEEFNRAYQTGTNPQEAYDTYNMEEVGQWLVDNKEEALDRLGPAAYKTILTKLRRWTDPSYKNSTEETLDYYNDYARAVRFKKPAEIPEEGLYKLAILVQQPNAAEICGDTEQNKISEKIKTTIKSKFPERIIPSIGYCKRALGMEVSEDDLSPIERVQLRLQRLTVPEEIKSAIQNVITGFKNSDGLTFREDYIKPELIGRVNETIIREINNYRKQLNREYYVGMKAPFEQSSIQEFFDAYRDVFKLGLTVAGCQKVFKQIANVYKNKFEEEARAHFSNDSHEEEDLDLGEAMRLVRRHGYIVE